MNQGAVFGQGLGDGFGTVVPESVVGKIQGLKYAEFRGKDVVDGLCSLEGDLVGAEVYYSDSIVF